jgi:hypothetical protein
MNKYNKLRHEAKYRYDELAKLTTTKRTNIQNWFTRNKRDVLKDKDFEFYKERLEK